MNHYITFAETEALLLTALTLKGRSIAEIGAATGIKSNTLYKFKTTNVHLSPAKSDALLQYFIENEPERLELAEIVQQHTNK